MTKRAGLFRLAIAGLAFPLAMGAGGGRPPVSDALRPVLRERGVIAAMAHYAGLRATRPDAFDFSERHLDALGYELLDAGEARTAVALFQRLVAMYPDSWRAHDGLGEGYAALGRPGLAIAQYRRSLELNPRNITAAEALARLERDHRE